MMFQYLFYLIICFLLFLSIAFYHNLWDNGAALKSRALRHYKSVSETLPLLSIYIHSGPELIKGRQLQRKHCFPLYKQYNISSTFVVGRPSFDNRPHDAHAQGQQGTAKDQFLSHTLFNESMQYNDILLLQHRDYYRDMTDKMLAYFKHDYINIKSKYIFKTDDEYCLNISKVLSILKSYEGHENELYVGSYFHNGTEYSSMKGPRGEVAPFSSGAALGVSRGLVKNIVVDNWDHSCMYHMYGTSSDDANLGKWILYAKEQNNVSFDYVNVAGLNYEIKI